MGSRVRPEVQPLSTTGQICNLGQVTWHNEAPILLSIKNWKDCIYLQFPERIKQDGPSEAFTFWSRQQWRLMAGGPTPSTPHARLKHTAMIDDFFFFLAALGLCCCTWATLWLQCLGFALLWPLLLQSTGSRHSGFNIRGHGLSYSTTCGILSDQELNLCPLPWQADS